MSLKNIKDGNVALIRIMAVRHSSHDRNRSAYVIRIGNDYESMEIKIPERILSEIIIPLKQG